MPGFRSAVLRIFQKTAGKGFRFTGFLIGKNPGTIREIESIITMAGSSPPVST